MGRSVGSLLRQALPVRECVRTQPSAQFASTEHKLLQLVGKSTDGQPGAKTGIVIEYPGALKIVA